ncbi:hypothetical protein ON010_g8924 [Phytophthora cinnamomi]|nr:hypothetical protein ON010_g8924 [Phytophthora cinnamomi]
MCICRIPSTLHRVLALEARVRVVRVRSVTAQAFVFCHAHLHRVERCRLGWQSIAGVERHNAVVRVAGDVNSVEVVDGLDRDLCVLAVDVLVVGLEREPEQRHNVQRREHVERVVLARGHNEERDGDLHAHHDRDAVLVGPVLPDRQDERHRVDGVGTEHQVTAAVERVHAREPLAHSGRVKVRVGDDAGHRVVRVRGQARLVEFELAVGSGGRQRGHEERDAAEDQADTQLQQAALEHDDQVARTAGLLSEERDRQHQDDGWAEDSREHQDVRDGGREAGELRHELVADVVQREALLHREVVGLDVVGDVVEDGMEVLHDDARQDDLPLALEQLDLDLHIVEKALLVAELPDPAHGRPSGKRRQEREVDGG